MDFSSQDSINEVTCPICQELLREPMSLDCGHSFCQDCITAHSDSGNPLGLECCCPVCQNRYRPWNVQFNWQLAERVKKFREVDMSSHQPRRKDLCEHHGENYDTFCKDDGKAICRLCVQEHQDHQMSPIMEVVKECQEKLQEALKKLSQEQQEAEQLEADINEERTTWKRHMQTKRERILQRFEEMRGILDKEKQRGLQKLEEDEVNVLDNLTVAKDQVVQQKQYMSELISGLQHHMHESTIDMLQDVINILRRCEVYTLKKPKIVSNKPKSTFQLPDLSGMLQKFKEICEPEEPQIRTDRSKGAAAMASGVLLNIKQEVTCPICLELLTEPVSLGCGHTFCQACITANNKESIVSEEGQSSCPVCRITYQSGNLRPNRHVANIVETLREVKLSPKVEQKTELCERHGEKLLLFCKEDGKFICWLCERSQEHRGHHTFLMEEVAQEYKEKLQAALNRLKAEQQEAEKFGADIKAERTSWKNLIQNDIQSVQNYFKKLRSFLDTEEQKELQKLAKEEGDILHDLEQSESELVQQSQVLRDLISELDHRLQGSMRKMLQDVNGIIERSKTFTLKKPKTVSKEQRRVFQVPDLSEMLQVFNGLMDMRLYWVYMSLHPLRKKSSVAISANRRDVRCVLDCRAKYTHQEENYDICAVLGVPCITSGKRYWEVDVSQKHAWVLGVCGEAWPGGNMPFVRKGKNYEPKYGYWVIALNSQFEYNAFEQSFLNCPPKVTLKLTVPPNRIGVFLDYDAGTVSFLNITNHGFRIYEFSSCSFSQKMYPYFNLMNCTGPMTVCSPSS